MKHYAYIFVLIAISVIFFGCSDNSENKVSNHNLQDLNMQEGIYALMSNQFNADKGLWGIHTFGCTDGMNLFLVDDAEGMACSDKPYNTFLYGKRYLEIALSDVESGTYDVIPSFAITQTNANQHKASIHYIIDDQAQSNGAKEDYTAYSGSVIIKNLEPASRTDYLDRGEVEIELKDVTFFRIAKTDIRCFSSEDGMGERCTCTDNDGISKGCDQNQLWKDNKDIVFMFNHSFKASPCKAMTYGPNLDCME